MSITPSTIIKMKKTVSILSFLVICLSSFSQTYVGVFGGISNYAGDLEDKRYNFKQTKGVVGLTLLHQITERFSLRGGVTFAKLAGNDKYSASASLVRRNLNFQSNLFEVSALAEWNALSLENSRWTPYVFGGIAIYHFNPYTTDTLSNKIYLQPLSTEGQGIQGYNLQPYNRTQLALPFGGGVKFSISENVRLGLEVGIRKLFTDYLDDVSTNYADINDLRSARGQLAVNYSYRGDEIPSGNLFYPNKGEQRGSPKQKDLYYFTGLHLSFRIPSGASSFRMGGRKSNYGCPPVPY